MSSEKLNDTVDILSVRYTKLPVVAETSKEDLADFVRRIREGKRLSVNDVALRSGGGISKAYVSQIENRYVSSVTSGRLRALARGLGIPYEQISAVAGGITPESLDSFKQSKFGELFELYSVLPTAEQKRLDATLEMLKLWLERQTLRIPVVEFDDEKKPGKRKAS
jgi:transcriptional regulator with XRE-family HTH domain